MSKVLNSWYQGEFGVQNGDKGQKYKEMYNQGPNGHQMMVENHPKTEYRCWKNRGSSLTRGNNANFYPRGVDFQLKHNCEILGQNFNM